MRKLIVIAVLAFPFFLFAQNKPTYDLLWKIAKDETIGYETVMKLVDTSNFKIKFDVFDDVFRSLKKDSSDADTDVMEDMFKDLMEQHKDIGYFTILEEDAKNREQFDYRMIGYAISEKGENNFMLQARKGVQLRGKFRKTGGLASWYYKESQRNLLNVLMELPEKPVAVGESWSVDCNFLTLDQTFITDSVFSSNKVTLIKVDTIGEDLIALIEYDINDYVVGSLNHPMFESKKDGLFIISYKGFARFNITKGRWEEYSCILYNKIKGLASQESSTLFQMKLTDDIPEKVLKYE